MGNGSFTCFDNLTAPTPFLGFAEEDHDEDEDDDEGGVSKIDRIASPRVWIRAVARLKKNSRASRVGAAKTSSLGGAGLQTCGIAHAVNSGQFHRFREDR